MDEARGILGIGRERDPAAVGADDRIDIRGGGAGGAQKVEGLVAEAVLADHRGGDVGGGVVGAAAAHVAVHHEDVHRGVGVFVGGEPPADGVAGGEVVGEGGEGHVAAGGADGRVDAAEPLVGRRRGGIGGFDTGGGNADAGDRAEDAVEDEDVGDGVGVGRDQIAGLGAEGDVAAVGGEAGGHAGVAVERGRAAGAVARGGGDADGGEGRRGVGDVTQVDIAEAAAHGAAEIGGIGREGDILAVRTDRGLDTIAIAGGRGASGLGNEHGGDVAGGVEGAGSGDVAVAQVNMGHADGGAGRDEVGGVGFPGDVAAGGADGGLEVGPVGGGAGGREADAGDDAGEDVDDVDVRETVGVVEREVGGVGGERDVGAVGGEGGVVGGAVGLRALL